MAVKGGDFRLETVGSTDGEFVLVVHYPINDAGDVNNVIEVTNISFTNLVPVGQNYLERE